MKAIKFKESDYYSVELVRGSYLIDGVVKDVDTRSNVQVKDINNIILLLRTSVISHYINGVGEVISIEKYINDIHELLSHKTYSDEDDEYGIWDSLEDEFEYKKYIQLNRSICKEVVVEADPFKIEIVESQIESGNKFIISDYINGGADPILWIYDKYSAYIEIAKNKFNDLDMEFRQKAEYKETANAKIWGNSTFSCIRYVTAFGTYPFNQSFEISPNKKRGTLSSLLAEYDNDKYKIEKIIQDRYNETFGIFDEKNINVKGCLEQLRNASRNLGELDYNKKGKDTYRLLCKNVNTSIELLQSAFKQN